MKNERMKSERMKSEKYKLLWNAVCRSRRTGNPHFSLFTLSLFTLSLFTLSSCSSDDTEPYPPLITELVMAQADAEGMMASFTTDEGRVYAVENKMAGMEADSRLRCLCGYVVGDGGRATVYTAQAVPILRDASALTPAKHDPTGIASAWLAGGFLNLHLTPRTQGGSQAWGYLPDSVTANAAGGRTFHLSLYHRQAGDTPAYTTDLYASISLDSLSTAFTSADSLRLTVETFTRPAVWLFACPDCSTPVKQS